MIRTVLSALTFAAVMTTGSCGSSDTTSRDGLGPHGETSEGQAGGPTTASAGQSSQPETDTDARSRVQVDSDDSIADLGKDSSAGTSADTSADAVADQAADPKANREASSETSNDDVRLGDTTIVVHVALEEGFNRERVTVGLGLEQLELRDVTTRLQIGLAQQLEFSVSPGSAELVVSLPDRDLRLSHQLDVRAEWWIGISLVGETLTLRESSQLFGYL